MNHKQARFTSEFSQNVTRRTCFPTENTFWDMIAPQISLTDRLTSDISNCLSCIKVEIE